MKFHALVTGKSTKLTLKRLKVVLFDHDLKYQNHMLNLRKRIKNYFDPIFKGWCGFPCPFCLFVMSLNFKKVQSFKSLSLFCVGF